MGNKEGYIATVKVGPKGQIVIPNEVRKMLGIESGELLVLMATPQNGIGITTYANAEQILHTLKDDKDSKEFNKKLKGAMHKEKKQ